VIEPGPSAATGASAAVTELMKRVSEAKAKLGLAQTVSEAAAPAAATKLSEDSAVEKDCNDGDGERSPPQALRDPAAHKTGEIPQAADVSAAADSPPNAARSPRQVVPQDAAKKSEKEEDEEGETTPANIILTTPAVVPPDPPNDAKLTELNQVDGEAHEETTSLDLIRFSPSPPPRASSESFDEQELSGSPPFVPPLGEEEEFGGSSPSQEEEYLVKTSVSSFSSPIKDDGGCSNDGSANNNSSVGDVSMTLTEEGIDDHIGPDDHDEARCSADTNIRCSASTLLQSREKTGTCGGAHPEEDDEEKKNSLFFSASQFRSADTLDPAEFKRANLLPSCANGGGQAAVNSTMRDSDINPMLIESSDTVQPMPMQQPMEEEMQPIAAPAIDTDINRFHHDSSERNHVEMMKPMPVERDRHNRSLHPTIDPEQPPFDASASSINGAALQPLGGPSPMTEDQYLQDLQMEIDNLMRVTEGELDSCHAGGISSSRSGIAGGGKRRPRPKANWG